jgi:hypothetical protein
LKYFFSQEDELKRAKEELTNVGAEHVEGKDKIAIHGKADLKFVSQGNSN